MSKDNFSVQKIPSQETYEWLLKKHYAHRIPSISYAYGLYENNSLKGVCTFGPGANMSLNNIADNPAIELNRLCVESEEKNITSWFVSKCLNSFNNIVVFSFADTEQGHIGKIYQACNFIYTGESEGKRFYIKDGKEYHRKTLHDIGISNIEDAKKEGYEYFKGKGKHRYIYICGNKTFKKEVMKALNYPICAYPKGETKRYDASYKSISQMVMF